MHGNIRMSLVLKKSRLAQKVICAAVLISNTLAVSGQGLKNLPGHVPRAAARLTPKGRLPATNELSLAIEVPMRDREGLENFVKDVSDPNSPNFRRFLTPDEITARFGPTEEDYEAVKNFARTNGFVVRDTYSNRLVLNVSSPAAMVEKAFHIKLQTYQHPKEAREFFAPDTEPKVDAKLPVAYVEGLNNYSRPHSKKARVQPPKGIPKNGSSPDGYGAIFGDDFRHAYVPGTALTGAGQSIGFFEWDGSYTNSLAAYAEAAGGGRTNIALRYVLLEGYDGKPTQYGGEGEVDMDIEIAMAMAPGLSNIVVFEGNPYTGNPITILNAMASSNSIKNLSCSWGWSPTDEPYTNLDSVYLQMAAQGQSFFNASGDSGAFTTGVDSSNGLDNPANYNAPSSDPYVTQVGGTLLTMGGSGAAWNSEAVWNSGLDASGDHFDNSASSGGISSYYTIPSWQTNVSNLAAAGGSTAFRNVPDVAACGINIYEILDNPPVADDYGGGTSASAPLWAGFMALVNQQSAARGGPSGGLINPTLYALAAGPNYHTYFHDVTVGSNTWVDSPNLFRATSGYDLCTGLGTINGTNLLNALATSASAPQFLSPVQSANGLTLTWTTFPGKTYQVQYSTNLSSPNWFNLGSPSNAASSTESVTDGFTNAQRFYRVLQQ
jgi:subtilase family serine protease